MDIYKIYDILKSCVLDSNLYLNESMKNHTSFKIGGCADIFINSSNIDEIKNILQIVKKENIPLTIVGNGTNLLVKDNGIRGIVLKPNIKDLDVININKEEVEIIVGSGVQLPYLSNVLMKNEIKGFEFASSIPGTFGGAVTMNAGAHGLEIKDILIETTYMDYNGNIYIINNSEHKFNYRYSIFQEMNVIILNSKLKFTYGRKEEILEKIKEYKEYRIRTQPIGIPCAGSSFKRGKDFITAKLIDDCGLKGYKLGGAQVSEKHAGFIVNVGDATCENVLDLVEYIEEKVYNIYGKKLELEMKIIGE